MKTIFCPECRKEVEYTVTHQQKKSIINNTEYIYNGKEAYCKNCGKNIFVGDIHDYNLKALYDVFRKEKGLISLENIREIPTKYDIGKRPLSLLLGWGEHTFSRFYDGDIPSKQYSDILIKIHQDSSYYEELLETGKDRISTVAYHKSRKKVDEILNPTLKSTSKIDLSIQYLLNQCEDITPLALQKALYYIQGFYYAFYGIFLFNEDCEAWVHGPAYREIYRRYQNYHFDPIKPNPDFDTAKLTDNEKEIIDSVIVNICCYSGKTLEKFTHNEDPWILARDDLPLKESSDAIMSKDSIGSYFVSVKDKYHMDKPSDIKKYSYDMFSKL